MFKQNLKKSLWVKMVALVTIQIFVFTSTGLAYSTPGSVPKVKKDLRVSSAHQSEAGNVVKNELYYISNLQGNEGITTILDSSMVKELGKRLSVMEGLITSEKIEKLLKNAKGTFKLNAEKIKELARVIPVIFTLGTTTVEMAEEERQEAFSKINEMEFKINEMEFKIAELQRMRSERQEIVDADYLTDSSREHAREQIAEINAEIETLEEQKEITVKRLRTVDLSPVDRQIQELKVKIAEKEAEADAYDRTAMAGYYSNTIRERAAENRDALLGEVKELEQQRFELADTIALAGDYLNTILAEIFPDDIDFVLRSKQVSNLRDEKNKRAVVINYRHLLEPGMAEVLKKIIDQLKGGDFKFVLDMDNLDVADEVNLYRGIKKATYDGVDLKGAFDLVISSKISVNQAVQRIIKELDVQTIAFFGPQEWAANYRDAWKSIAETRKSILLVSEIGEGSNVAQPLGLKLALNAFLVDEGILNTEEIRVLASYWNESRRSYDIPRKNVGEKHQEFAEYYRATAASE